MEILRKIGLLRDFSINYLFIAMLLVVGLLLITSGCASSSSQEVNKEGMASEAVRKLERPEVVSTASEALKLLEDGNKRFVNYELADKELGHVKRQELLEGQKPFAIILSCSDSRVPPEIVFDQGLGDLFVIRVAGNVADQIALGSIEYAVEHLKVPLLVVMGHSSCGAVKATAEGGDVPPNIAAIAKKIKPSVDVAKGMSTDEEEIVDLAVNENIKSVVKEVTKNSSIVAEAIEKGKLKVVGAKYHLDSGKVEYFDKIAE